MQNLGPLFCAAAFFACAAAAALPCRAAQVYLWRQSYDAQTGGAVRAAAQNFEAVNFLFAKISFENASEPRLKFMPINPRDLRGADAEKIACVRIEGLAAGAEKYAEISPKIAKMLQACAEKAAREIGISGLQVDFDCPESKLGCYALWLENARRLLPESLSLSITAVPSQMDAPNFCRAIARCDYFVLQIHNIAPCGGELKIFDFEKSMGAVRRADKFGKKFLVALPTYSHFVKFGESGRAEKIFSENFAARAHENAAGVKKISSDFFEVARLSREIKSANLKNCAGEIYFRLPCGGEISNWSMETLLSVAGGGELERRFRAFAAESGAISEIFLENTGNVDLLPPLEIECECGDFRYCEGINGFVFSRKTSRGAALKNSDELFFRLKPGEKIKAGWIKK